MAMGSLLADWTTGVIEFLRENLQFDDEREGWNHTFTTAYQIGCEALAALGQAEETEWGAVPLANPRLPDVLPRWDDICVAVLKLAGQRSSLGYRLADGSVPLPGLSRRSLIITREDASSPPSPNIAAAHGLGPAYAAPEPVGVLESLGLVMKGKWTDAAETIVWRDLPRAWELDISSDPRFACAVEQALVTMSADMRADMNRLVTVTEEEVAEGMTRHTAWNEEHRAKYGPKAVVFTPTSEGTRRAIESSRRNELDWLFFRRWRLADGWLSPSQTIRALEIFHDPLAIAMRRAVVARLYGEHVFSAEM